MSKISPEYENFINTHNNLTRCQKKSYLMNDIFNYPENYDNYQYKYKYLVTEIYNNKRYKHERKFSLMIMKFASKKLSDNLFNIISKNNFSDIQVLNIIKKNKEKNKKSIYNKHCKEWEYILQFIALHYHKIVDTLKLDKNTKYLDIGSGDGYKTEYFGKELNALKIAGSDIDKWARYNQENIKKTFDFYKIENNRINVEENTFNVCSCMVMLHHLKCNDLNSFLQEIKRILVNNGVLIIVEHNCHNSIDSILFDLLHLNYEYLIDGNKDALSDFQGNNYYDIMHWEFIMKNNGFKKIKSKTLFPSIYDELRHDNLFVSFYLNIKV